MKTRYGLEIRAATSADAPGLCELFQEAGVALSPLALGKRLEAMRQQPGAALIALEWGPPSGLVLFHWYTALQSDQRRAQITTLLVGPQQRRRGIGRLLIKAAAQAARTAGCGALELLAAAEQPGLREFCLATGFSDVAGCFARPLRKGA